eukprot:1151760-Pelagomonas_calceolata.AAC.7
MKGTQLTSSPLARSNPCLSSSRSLPCRPAHLAIQRLPVRANAGGEAKPTADTSEWWPCSMLCLSILRS